VHWQRKSAAGAGLARWHWRLNDLLLALFAGSALWLLGKEFPYAAPLLAWKYCCSRRA